MTEIEGYKVVPLRLTPKAKHCHTIYMREHFIRLVDPNKPKGRTLFLLNVPPYVTTESLKKFYSEIGHVISVAFAERAGRDETEKWLQNCTPFSNLKPPYRFKVAYVVFKQSISVHRALELDSIDLYSKGTGESLVESGMQLWHSEYDKRILDEETAQEEINKYMAGYDKREREQFEANKTKADSDGWTTVGRNVGFEQKESVVNRLEGKIERSKKKELTNFYTFQIRESKMKNIIELRKRFEEDKEKIERLKKARRFRPF